MGMRLSFAVVALAAMATVACPYSDQLLGTKGLTFGNGGGGGTGPDALSFTVQPSTATAGNIITPAIQVTVRDSLGNVDAAFTGAVTIGFAVNPVGGNLTGTRSVVPTNGVSSFGDLAIDKSGAGYQLLASAPGATSASSGTFNILAP
ncbi:MAG TPA: hypothetical protein VM716_03780 [Gemmatimonadales bacterium]|nr:hypothetical protein [Gemmatimonadales bacterium]